ncbi:MAG TPA: carbohydrate porin [Chlamydiales bacterium]|jgi:porin|nr:carbohydrate porin [Chlamydiales bacterium]
MRQFLLFFTAIFGWMPYAYGEPASYGISGNPGAVDIIAGTGELGRRIGIPESSGVRLGGVWLGDYNALMSGRQSTQVLTGNSSLIVDFSVNFEKAMGWTGGMFGVEFLQANGQPTNADAGLVQGYNSLPGPTPINRSELFQLWLQQALFDNKWKIWVGKTVPTFHFNNVSKPVPTVNNPAISIPSVSSLIYSPIFTNPTLSGVIGGYYNSVYGIESTLAPIKELYINMGFYDGNVARGVQTGLKWPHFNGYYFSILETGYGWAGAKPGIFAVGGWYQSGTLQAAGQTQTGTGGIYSFASRALWIRESKTVSKGNLSGFLQFGWNNSKTLNANLFFGGGLTAFAVIPNRPNDSLGIGLAWSRLNQYLFSRYSEFMLQTYYQAQVYGSIYFQPVFSYIPNPGAHPNRSNVTALTARIITLF